MKNNFFSLPLLLLFVILIACGTNLSATEKSIVVDVTTNTEAISSTVSSLANKSSAQKKYRPKYEDDDIMLRIVGRTPESISAFYQGREFNKQAINEILNTCYVTVIVKNKTQTTLWLELDNWLFSQNGKNIDRIKRDYWKKRWDKIKLNQAHRSTFGWTLMPDSRDLRADEGVGGSIVIPLQTAPFTMTANFHTRPDKSGPIKTVIIQGAKCVEDIQPQQ